MSKRKFRIDVAECSEKHANKLCYDMVSKKHTWFNDGKKHVVLYLVQSVKPRGFAYRFKRILTWSNYD